MFLVFLVFLENTCPQPVPQWCPAHCSRVTCTHVSPSVTLALVFVRCEDPAPPVSALPATSLAAPAPAAAPSTFLMLTLAGVSRLALLHLALESIHSNHKFHTVTYTVFYINILGSCICASQYRFTSLQIMPRMLVHPLSLDSTHLSS